MAQNNDNFREEINKNLVYPCNFYTFASKHCKFQGGKKKILFFIHLFAFGPQFSSSDTFSVLMMINNLGFNTVLFQFPSRVGGGGGGLGGDEIIIAGEKEGVLTRKAAVTAIGKEREENCPTIPVEVEKLQHRHVIGSKGNFVNEIFTETVVEMPSNNNAIEPITVTPRCPKDKLELALNKGYELQL